MPNKKILLVDDDDQFVDMLQKTLTRSGYSTLRARNGREALQLYDPGKISLVLTDLLMPDVEGIELILELARRRDGIKIIAMSGGGNAPEANLRAAQYLGAAMTLSKPFSTEQLFSSIQTVLGEKAPQRD